MYWIERCGLFGGHSLIRVVGYLESRLSGPVCFYFEIAGGESRERAAVARNRRHYLQLTTPKALDFSAAVAEIGI